MTQPNFGPQLTTYDRLTILFRDVEFSLGAEDRTILDGHFSDLSKEWEATLQLLNKTFHVMLAQERMNCARAMCPMCSLGLKRIDVNGRDVHIEEIKKNDLGAGPESVTYVKCAANPIWSMK